MFEINIFTIEVQQSSCCTIREGALVVNNIACTIYPHIVIIFIHKGALCEVHVAIREKFAIDSATFHIDRAGMLEAMIVGTA